MAVDVADYTQAVNVTGGSVAITGTATVQITGTPAVTISGTPNVAITNTPAVTISSGTVTIGGTPTISIVAQTITVSVQQPMVTLGTVSSSTPNQTLSATFAVPVGCSTINVMIPAVVGDFQPSRVVITGFVTGRAYYDVTYPVGGIGASQPPGDDQSANWLDSVPINSADDTSITVQLTHDAGGGTQSVRVSAARDGQAIHVRNVPWRPLHVNVVGPGQLKQPVIISTNVNGQVIVAGIVGQRIYPRMIGGSVDGALGANWWRLVETSANGILAEFSTADTAWRWMNYENSPLPLGAGLRIDISGGSQVRGAVAYAQG